MKNIFKYLLSVLLFAGVANAQAIDVIRNNNAATVIQSNNLGKSKLSTDDKGKLFVMSTDPSSGLSQSVIPLSTNIGGNGAPVGLTGWYSIGTDTAETSSTVTVINATSHAARINDQIVFFAGGAGGLNTGSISYVTGTTANTITISPALTEAPVNGNGFYINRAATLTAGNPNQASGSALVTTIDSSHKIGTSFATNILKLEDAAHTTGDAGVQALGVRNEGGTALTDANGDYSLTSVNRAGAVYVTLSSLLSGDNSAAKQPVRDEDVAFGASDALIVVGGQTVSAIGQTVGAAGDVAPPSMDLGNRLVTTNAPAGEFFSNCSGSATGVVDVAIKAAVASNRSYVTSITCSNTAAAVSTEVEIRDGTTVMDVGYVASTTLGESSWTKSYPTPMRGSVNTAWNVRPVTTSSATRCCVQGYISTI
jgi:hypothetical protein